MARSQSRLGKERNRSSNGFQLGFQRGLPPAHQSLSSSASVLVARMQEVANRPADFLPLLIMVLVALLVAGVVIALPTVLGPKNPTKTKGEAYESGIIPFGDTRRRFPVQYYLIAVLFIIFDIEVVFLYPWAATLQNPALKYTALGAMALFLGIVVIGFLYEWRKGALDWD